jgi:hypothetical protein
LKIKTLTCWAIVILSASALNISQAQGDDPIHFTNDPHAIANANIVLNAWKVSSSRKEALKLIGSKVVFVGGCAPPGGTPNLLLENGIVLNIDFSNHRKPKLCSASDGMT